MAHADWLQSPLENEQPLQASVWPAIRVFLLVSLVATRILSLAVGADLDIGDIWLIVGAVTILVLTRDSLKRYRHKNKRYENDLVPMAHVVRRYTVPELGGVFVYLPLPQRTEDKEIWALLPVLRNKELIRGGPWWLDARRKSPWLSTAQPHLCSMDVSQYEIYRLSSEFTGILR